MLTDKEHKALCWRADVGRMRSHAVHEWRAKVHVDHAEQVGDMECDTKQNKLPQLHS
jgi:hypothetical protein